jgi:acyl-CoA synthetase (AMP-forming)/AMP-acid ligase II
VFLAGVGERAKSTPHAMAITDGETTLTWAQLAAAVEGAATMLGRLAPDTRLGVTGENAVATLVAHLAGLACGVGTVALHRQATAAELRRELADADCQAVVLGPSTVAAAELALTGDEVAQAVVHGASAPPGFTSWHEWISAPAGVVNAADVPARPLMVYTSGTTGRPRATAVTWIPSARALSARDYLAHIAQRSGFPDGAHLVVGPLQHNGPLTSLRHLIAGHPVVVMPHFEPADVLRLIERYGITSTVMVPTHFSRLLSLPADIRDSANVTSLQMVAHTGAACPEQVKRAMIEWWGPVLVESYGGSELGTVARITSPEWLSHPGSVGKALPPLTIAAYDDAGNPLEAGQTGVLGVELTDGREVKFLADEHKSRQAYLRPGVATLGDVGYVDTEGFVYITDRLADMVLSGGVNLYPAECEQVLIRHNAVTEVAVVGVPDPDMGEALHALVVPAGPDLDLNDLDAFCRAELAGFKCPRSYEIVAELIRNEMGKVDKRAMRARFWDSARTGS